MNLWNGALNQLDEETLEAFSAFELEKNEKGGRIMKGAIRNRGLQLAAAAAVLLLIAGAVLLFRRPAGNDPIDTAQIWKEVYNTSSNETADTSSIVSRYWAHLKDAYRSYIPSRVCTEDHLGDLLLETEANAYWENNSSGEFVRESEEEILRTRIYACKGIDPERAVILQFLDKGEALTTDHYYVYLNPEAAFPAADLGDGADKNDLGAFYRAYGMDQNLTLKPAQKEFPVMTLEEIVKSTGSKNSAGQESAGKGSGAAQEAGRKESVGENSGQDAANRNAANIHEVSYSSYSYTEEALTGLRDSFLKLEGSLLKNVSEDDLYKDCPRIMNLQAGMEDAGFSGRIKVYGSGYLKISLAGLDDAFFSIGKDSAKACIDAFVKAGTKNDDNGIIIGTTSENGE